MIQESMRPPSAASKNHRTSSNHHLKCSTLYVVYMSIDFQKLHLSAKHCKALPSLLWPRSTLLITLVRPGDLSKFTTELAPAIDTNGATLEKDKAIKTQRSRCFFAYKNNNGFCVSRENWRQPVGIVFIIIMHWTHVWSQAFKTEQAIKTRKAAFGLARALAPRCGANGCPFGWSRRRFAGAPCSKLFKSIC